MADDISNEEDLWAAAAEDLEQQRQLLRDASTAPKAAAPAAAAATASAPPAVRSEKDPKMEMILDIPLGLSVELGRAKMLINDLLQLGQGSVIELTKLVGEPLDVLVNDKLVARGEVVVVNNEKFGVRLSEVISPQERIEKLS
ncbi:MAG: flagellar motor switch protein FliN [Nitrospinae bacterium]|nr:flagellar motor switch protein FliN [Nitrospinota bacterium]